MQSYQQLEKIGKGSSGKIYKLRNIHSGKIEALKKVDLRSLSKNQIKDAEHEIHILKNLNHPNILQFHDSFISGNYLCIITEFCALGDLSKFLKNSLSPLPENIVMKLFVQVLLGVEYLHKKQIIHRDIKAMNIFLKPGLKVKIGDLGIARHLNSSYFASTVVGTPFYLSPELCQERPYNYKSDIWALGCLLYELCSREPPFKASENKTLREMIVEGEFKEVPSFYSKEINHIIRQILKLDPRDRPSVEEILAFSFVRKKMEEFKLTPNNFTLKIKNKPNQIKLRSKNIGIGKSGVLPFLKNSEIELEPLKFFEKPVQLHKLIEASKNLQKQNSFVKEKSETDFDLVNSIKFEKQITNRNGHILLATPEDSNLPSHSNLDKKRFLPNNLNALKNLCVEKNDHWREFPNNHVAQNFEKSSKKHSAGRIENDISRRKEKKKETEVYGSFQIESFDRIDKGIEVKSLRKNFGEKAKFGDKRKKDLQSFQWNAFQDQIRIQKNSKTFGGNNFDFERKGDRRSYSLNGTCSKPSFLDDLRKSFSSEKSRPENKMKQSGFIKTPANIRWKNQLKKPVKKSIIKVDLLEQNIENRTKKLQNGG